jgi:hypothetical protein
MRYARPGVCADGDTPTETLIRPAALLERLLEQIGRVVVPEDFGPRDERAVGGHLVVLGALASGDEARVHRGVVEVLFHDRLALFDDPGDAVAMLASDFSPIASNTCSRRNTWPPGAPAPTCGPEDGEIP